MIPKLKLEILNPYMLLGWVFVFAGLIGVLFYIMSPGAGLEAVLGFSVASFFCGLIMIYLGTTKKKIFKK
ncbi:hypothetical protein [Methanocella arvoryzae]|uniref:hypothetical protein n=1 Tax=Methanocella arvoryzae TaxID=1175445 RepID=UPI0000DB2421|nr:hypothetical protein [Methanocella arvoryzae]